MRRKRFIVPRRRATLLTGRAGVRKITYKGQEAFYRVTGYRDSAGLWQRRNPRSGHWYAMGAGLGIHPGKGPTASALRASDKISIELEFAGSIHHFTVDGRTLGSLG